MSNTSSSSSSITPHSLQTKLKDKILDHTATVGVIGLGYVGLPLAVEKAKVKYHVTGFDRSVERVALVNRGENYIGDVQADDLKEVVQQGFLTATTDMAKLADMDAIIICVPTPLDTNLSPDLSYVKGVTREIAKHLRPGQFVSLESTTYPGTTEDVMLPILAEKGLQVGEDFFLAHSPERVDPGNKRYSTKNTNKVVGGHDPVSLDIAVAFYGQTIDHIVPVSSAKAAEMVKVYENTFRAVNIALANEIALLCDRMGLSVWEVLDAAFTKPFGIMPFYPGPGVGGHCIPLDPHYLEWKAREFNFQTHFIALAGETNRKMPEFVVEKASRVLNMDKKALNGSRILMLGMAYKGDLDDYRESPAIIIYSLLEKAGAQVNFHDIWTPHIKEHGLDIHGVDLTDEAIKNADLVIITTKHSDVDYERVVNLSNRVLDTRHATKNIQSDKVVLL